MSDEQKKWEKEVDKLLSKIKYEPKKERDYEPYIAKVLKEYSEKTGYPVPKVKWKELLIIPPIFTIKPAWYDIEEKAIFINESYMRERWAKISGREELIRSILAEEFWHSVQDIKGQITPNTFTNLKLMEEIEQEARQIGDKLSGVSEYFKKHLEEYMLTDSFKITG